MHKGSVQVLQPQCGMLVLVGHAAVTHRLPLLLFSQDSGEDSTVYGTAAKMKDKHDSSWAEAARYNEAAPPSLATALLRQSWALPNK